MENETIKEEQKVPFQNGEKPTVEDFKRIVIIPAKIEGEEVIEEEKRIEEPITTLSGTDTKGNQVKYVLLSDKRIATIREGKGSDVEKASMEASGDSSKYLTSMMAACVTFDSKGTNMYDFGKLKMKDYMNVQLAFSELNF